jgi:iron(III) transport system permease protein
MATPQGKKRRLMAIEQGVTTGLALGRKSSRRRRSIRSPGQLLEAALRNWPFVVAVVVLLLLVIVPLTLLGVSSFKTGTPGNLGEWTIDNYRRVFQTPETFRALRNTVVVATVSTAISLVLAIIFAWLIERTDMPFRNLSWTILLLPIAVPSILFVLSWTVLLSPRAGLLNVLIRNHLPLFDWDTGPFHIYGLGGVIFLDAVRGVTTIFLMLVAAFRLFDPAMEEAAKVGGANVLQTLLRVTLPVLTPAVLAAGMYSFISSMDQFEAALAVGLPGGVYLLSTLIYFTVSLRVPVDYGAGAVYSVLFMAIMVLLVLAYRRIVRHSEQFATVSGKGYRPQRVSLGRWRYPAFAVVALFGTITVFLPMAVMVWLSLRPLYAVISLGSGVALSFDNYVRLFNGYEFGRVVWNTIWMTLATATVTMALAFLVSWCIVRGSARGRGLLDGLTFLPYAFPGITIALAMIFVFLNPPLNVLPVYGTVAVLVVALTTQYIAFGSRLMNGAIVQVKAELEDAGSVAGAKPLAIMRRITLPLLIPAVVTGWIWVAANAMRSFSIPVILASRNNEVFASQIWSLWQIGRFPEAAAYGTMLVLILLPMTLLLRWLISRLGNN